MSAVLEPQRPLVPDAELMIRLAQRDSTALIELERRHRNSLYAQAYALLVDSTVAERVVRNAFAQLWHSAAQLAGRRSAWSCLRQLAADLAREERADRDSRGMWRNS